MGKCGTQWKENTPLPHPEDTPEMINIREKIQKPNQQIEVMGCNRWEFQELHRLRQQLKQLAQEESDAKQTDLMLSRQKSAQLILAASKKTRKQ